MDILYRSLFRFYRVALSTCRPQFPALACTQQSRLCSLEKLVGSLRNESSRHIYRTIHSRCVPSVVLRRFLSAIPRPKGRIHASSRFTGGQWHGCLHFIAANPFSRPFRVGSPVSSFQIPLVRQSQTNKKDSLDTGSPGCSSGSGATPFLRVQRSTDVGHRIEGADWFLCQPNCCRSIFSTIID